ncbi:hypothetical protein DDM91_18470, partial [Vibrio cholerae]|nr:hypothetical protein [Vibrio cholerae]
MTTTRTEEEDWRRAGSGLVRMDADADFILKTAPHHRTSYHVIGQNDREAVRVPVTPELSPEFRTFTLLTLQFFFPVLR